MVALKLVTRQAGRFSNAHSVSVADSSPAESGSYYLYNNQDNLLGLVVMSQNLPTVPSQQYLISYWWWCAPFLGRGPKFRLKWNGNTVLDQINMPQSD